VSVFALPLRSAYRRLAVGIVAQVHHPGRTWDTSRRRRQFLVLRLGQPVLDEEMEVIPLVEDPAANVRVQSPKPSHLAILLRHEALIHRGDLDEDVLVREVEVGAEELRRRAIGLELDGELAGFELPRNVIEVEQPRELALTLMGELDKVRRLSLEIARRGQLARASDTVVRRADSAGSGNSRRISPSSSACTGPTAIPKTPWPRWKTSTTSSALRAA